MAKTYGYWAATGLVAFAMLAGGVMDLARPAELLEGMRHLGYPDYFMTILGTWKVLGALAIVAPRTPLLKEWAYAGIVFDLTGAFASHLASGDGADKLGPTIVLTALAVASWSLRPEARRLPGASIVASGTSSASAPSRQAVVSA
ncbi:MAG: DoxX family protein [Sandaracinaceae bacterium]|nr:DoxX family protein [Sandaracinaceae bacterium]